MVSMSNHEGLVVSAAVLSFLPTFHGEDTMKYVLLGQIGAEWALKHEERVEAGLKKARKLGIKVESMNYVQGPYDFVTIVDAPDAEAMLAFSLWYANKGLGKLMSLPAFDGKTMVKAAGRV